MPEHKYPRRWVNAKSEDGSWEPLGGSKRTLFVEVERPGAKYICHEEGGAILRHEDYGREKTCERWAYSGHWREVFDHHEEAPEIKAEFEKRCAIVYLKSVVRDLRAKVAALESENRELRNGRA